MSADTSDLKKVDSAVAGLDEGKKRRTTSSAPGVMNINDLGTQTFHTLQGQSLTLS
jgi:hypothetical protein